MQNFKGSLMEDDKKVIFIGGTSYSGSTFFDMMIGNDPSGFSCGEVNALFYPKKEHHLNPSCGCSSKDCSIWNKVRKGGKNRLYVTLFELMPQIKFIVDSSKDPFWIESQTNNLKTQGIGFKSLLIWKNPYELAYSFHKKDRSKWDQIWLNYHRTYTTLVENWRSVPYSELTNNPETLENVCRYLEIPYFENKKKFWEKSHHLLFGNNTARVHLYPDKNSNDIKLNKKPGKSNSKSDKKKFRSIYYERVDNKSLIEEVDKTIQANSVFKDVLDLLEMRSVNNEKRGGHTSVNIDLNPAELLLRRLISNLKKVKIVKLKMTKGKLLRR
jgi:hypothetical protein